MHPSIRFNDGTCKEAMNFYKNIFGGETEFMVARGTPMEKDMPADKLDLVMHATLKKDDWTLVASDMIRDRATVGDNMGIMLDCKNEEEINAIFKGLSEGGEVFMPVEKQFWGAWFGVVTDKYGVEWMLNCQIESGK